MELQGYVVIALTLILLGYLLPHLVRTRQLLLDSRVEDRFSGDLRILATAGSGRGAGGRILARAGSAKPGGHHGEVAARPYLHDPARRPEASMIRPRARTERTTEDARALAAARAARAGRVSRRAAAARRRLILTLALLLASVAAWSAVAGAGAAVTLGIVPTVLLAGVLVLGRRTAVKAAVHDKRDRAEMAQLEARLKAMSRRAAAAPPRRSTGSTAMRARTSEQARTSDAVGPGEDDVEVPAEAVATDVAERTGDGAEPSATTAERDDVEPPAQAGAPAEVEADVEPWTPVPVPAPSYTLKQTTPRRDVAPYAGPEVAAPTAAVPQRPTATSPGSAQPVDVSALVPGSASLDLDAVLARRRAAGE